jgi:SHS2 domain-containing protein
MDKFRFLDITTADVAFESFGKDLGELFANSALAMFEVMTSIKKVKRTIEKKVSEKGNDLQSLMFNWLNSLLLFVDSENMAFSKFDVKVDGKNFKLDARCWGEEINLKRHEMKTNVKAATYHQMKIEKSGNLWKAVVILDI